MKGQGVGSESTEECQCRHWLAYLLYKIHHALSQTDLSQPFVLVVWLMFTLIFVVTSTFIGCPVQLFLQQHLIFLSLCLLAFLFFTIITAAVLFLLLLSSTPPPLLELLSPLKFLPRPVKDDLIPYGLVGRPE